MTSDPILVTAIGVVFIAVLSVLAIAITPGDNQRQAQKRMRAVASRWRYASGDGVPDVRVDGADSSMRSFDRLIKRALPRPQVLRQRLARTGMKINIGEYLLASAFAGLLGAFLGGAVLHWTPLLSTGLALVCALGVPQLVVSYLTKRRQNKFTSQFPEAIDLIVRGLKSGLPVTESIKVVAKEIERPVGEEFQRIVDRLGVGKTMEEALWETAQRVDTPEIKFFVVALSVQKETGGNLAETLENLSDVLRKRRQMKQKIKALSSEAKASAIILGALPFIMFGMIMMVNRGYVMTLITDPRGHKLIYFGLASQVIGILIMVRMVKFEI